VKAPKVWSAGTVAQIRDAVAREPYIKRDDHTEWNWQFGAVWTKTPKRAAHCVACGQLIAPGTPALYVVHSETPAGGWTASCRYLHLEPCVPTEEP
jgi:hypothetical protein